MKTREKPKYSIWQNLCFSVKLAWQTRKRVLLVCVVMAVIGVLLNLAELYIAPEILAKVETHASLTELLLTIGGFTAVIFSLTVLNRYLYGTTFIPRVDIRSKIIAEINYKCFITSYPNCDDPDRKAMLQRAMDASADNQAAAEYIWTTVTELMTNLGGFAVYLMMLTGVEPVMLLVITLTSALKIGRAHV